MVNMLASSAVDCAFEPRSGQTKDYELDIIKEKEQRLFGSESE